MTTQQRQTAGGPMDELTCRQVIDLLMEYVDGRGDVAFRAAFEAHLAVCPSCVNYLRSYERTIELTREAFADGGEAAPMPPELVRAILAAQRERGEDDGGGTERGGGRR